MLKLRLLTAAIVLPLVLLAIWFLPPFWFSILTAIVIAFSAWEWSALIGIQLLQYRLFYVALIVASLGITFFVPIIYCLFLAFIFWLIASGAVLSYAVGRNAWGFNHFITKAISGFVVLMPFWLSMNVLHNTSVGPMLLIFVFLLVWSVDTGGYFVGRSCGKRLLIPKVSPKKTWEGLVGGLVPCVIVALFYGWMQQLSFYSILMLALLGLITGIFSVIGDLFESLLKRLADVKDSGNLLPGHGGILDRLDSAIAALPIFALGMLFFIA